MPNYKELYFELFAKVSDIVERLNEIQLELEEKYISDEDDNEEL